jgi:multiple sugar transport system permease protein
LAEPSLASPPTPQYRKKRIRWIDIKENLTGYLFILPAVAIVALFGIFPIAYAFYMSMHTWRVRKGPFVALDNYVKALGNWQGVAIFVVGFILLFIAYRLWTSAFTAKSNLVLVLKIIAALILIGSFFVITMGWGRMQETGDTNFLNSLPITLFYSLGTVPAEIFIGLVLAYILFQAIKGREFFRMLYFLPYITPVIATAVVFRTILSPRETSLGNQFIGLIGMGPFKWLFESKPFNQVFFGINLTELNLPALLTGPSMALVSITFFGIWTYIGYNTVIFWLV